jgi:hypothetical protein
MWNSLYPKMKCNGVQIKSMSLRLKKDVADLSKFVQICGIFLGRRQ